MNEEKKKVQFFNREDIDQLITETGLENFFVEEGAYTLLEEMGNNFIEQVLDTYKYKKKQLNLKDIENAVNAKFPQLCQQPKRNTEIIQRRVQQIDESQERVRQAQKARNKE